MVHERVCKTRILHLELQTTSFKWMFGETTISYVKIWNHPIETTIYIWLFRVPGSHHKLKIHCICSNLYYKGHFWLFEKSAQGNLFQKKLVRLLDTQSVGQKKQIATSHQVTTFTAKDCCFCSRCHVFSAVL